MKKIFFTTAFILVSGLFIYGQTFESRVAINEYDYLIYQMRETSGTNTPTTSMNVNDMAFQLRWLKTEGVDIELEPICPGIGNYYIADGNSGVKQEEGEYYYYAFYSMNTPFAFPNDWVVGEWETIAEFKLTNTTSPVVDIDVAPNGWVAKGHNIGIIISITIYNYAPTPNGTVTNYPLPTLVYNYVWEGGTGFGANRTHWEVGGNWRTECGAAVGGVGYPYYAEADAYALIPEGKQHYPETTSGGDQYGWACMGILIEDGAHVTVPDLTSNLSTPSQLYIDGKLIIRNGGTLTFPTLQPSSGTVTGNALIEGDIVLAEGTRLDIGGTLNIPSGGQIELYAGADATKHGAILDVTGATTLGATPGLILRSNQYGTASYIDGSLSGAGTATVERYLTDGSGLGDYYFHQVASPVANVVLQDYDLDPGFTYAFKYDGTLTYPDQWVNIWNYYTPVPPMMGMILSTLNSNTNPYTIELTNTPLSGSQSVTVPTGTMSLVGNPYLSPIDWDLMHGGQSGIDPTVYIWDETDGSSGNYRTFVADGSGGTGNLSCRNIQVGQSFFVNSTISGTQVSFNNSYRVHTYAPYLKNERINQMRLYTAGGNSSWDEVYFRFIDNEEASGGFDVDFDALKWASIYGPEATELWTVGSDNSLLTIDSRQYDSESISVPLHFKAAVDGVYQIGTESIESFEADIDVYLEDTHFPEQAWVNLKEEMSYSFTAGPDHDYARFIIHFFHKSFGLDENMLEPIQIYSHRTDAIILNNTEQRIREVLVYDMMGNLITNKVTVNASPLRFHVSDQTGYYVIKVITDKAVYSEKVLISK
jgi:hypothetical protein